MENNKKLNYIEKQKILTPEIAMRRSLRLQSRNEAVSENMKKAIKKIKLPRKRKVNLKRSKKPTIEKEPRRSTRIRKRNSFYACDEEKPTKHQNISQNITNLKIEPCEVKLEHIDALIEQMTTTQERDNGRDKNHKGTSAENKHEPEQEVNEQPLEPENPTTENKESCSTVDANDTTDIIEESEEEIPKERSEEQEEIARKMMEMFNQYKIQNEIDFDEINSISNNFHEDRIFENSWGREKLPNGYREKIINNVFFNNTSVYNFKSCFKDRASLTAAFDRHSGQVSSETYPYDINETPEAEKVKRFYRKNISDPNLHSWYQYNVASSRRFSKQDSEDIHTKPYLDKYLVF